TNSTRSAPTNPNPPTSTSYSACPTSPPPCPICATCIDVPATVIKSTAATWNDVAMIKKRMMSASGRSHPMSGRMSIESSKSHAPSPPKKKGASKRPQPKRTDRMRVQPSRIFPPDKLNAPSKVSAAISTSAPPASCSCWAGVRETANDGGGALRAERARVRGARGGFAGGGLPCATFLPCAFAEEELARVFFGRRAAIASNAINPLTQNVAPWFGAQIKKRTRRPLSSIPITALEHLYYTTIEVGVNEFSFQIDKNGVKTRRDDSSRRFSSQIAPTIMPLRIHANLAQIHKIPNLISIGI